MKLRWLLVVLISFISLDGRADRIDLSASRSGLAEAFRKAVPMRWRFLDSESQTLQVRGDHELVLAHRLPRTELIALRQFLRGEIKDSGVTLKVLGNIVLLNEAGETMDLDGLEKLGAAEEAAREAAAKPPAKLDWGKRAMKTEAPASITNRLKMVDFDESRQREIGPRSVEGFVMRDLHEGAADPSWYQRFQKTSDDNRSVLREFVDALPKELTPEDLLRRRKIFSLYKDANSPEAQRSIAQHVMGSWMTQAPFLQFILVVRPRAGSDMNRIADQSLETIAQTLSRGEYGEGHVRFRIDDTTLDLEDRRTFRSELAERLRTHFSEVERLVSTDRISFTFTRESLANCPDALGAPGLNVFPKK